MDQERWALIQDVFLDAVARPAGTRDAFLDDACSGDPELREEVEGLIRADDHHDGFLDVTLEDLVLLVDEDPQEPEPASGVPDRVGPYTILDELGRGGMGVVFRAERRTESFTREVALKVISQRAGSLEPARRFRREQQILAGLEHPHVARLYDAGVAEDGRPWLAMELVRGEPIHRYCDRERLTIPQRLALFEQVVEAVEFAHRNLVIHRDLKPSNILVTGDGEVKLLDFGIAKLLGEDDADAEEPLTRIDQRLLTPEYASPEQLQGRPLTTASDVYALGVLLHLLLTGRRPRVTADTRETTTSPSACVTRPPDEETARTPSPVALARARNTSPDALRRTLRGDLDTLMLRALRVEPGERYPTAAALLGDLVRYRTGRPLEARPPSLSYRTRKLLARHRGSALAATAALVSLVGGLGVAVHQARVARQERDAARSVSDFLENLFTASSPFQGEEGRMDTLRIGAFLEGAVERLDTDLANQPEVRARMQRLLGSVHENLGIYERADTLLRKALAGYTTLQGPDGPDVAATLGSLATLRQAAGDPAEAESYYRRALDVSGRLHGERSQEVADLRARLAGVLLEMDRMDEAEALLQASVDVRREELGDSSAQMGDHLNLLAALQYRQARLDEAVTTIRSALEVQRYALGPDHPNVAVVMQNLGLMLSRLGRLEEAEPVLRESLQRLRAAMGPDYPDLANTMKTLASVLDRMDRWQEADSLFAEAVAITRRTRGESRDLAINLHDYGGALMDRGDFDRARPLLEEAHRMEVSLTGRESPGAAITLGTLAELEREQGDAVRAEDLYRRSLETLLTVFPATHPRVLVAQGGIGRSLGDQGRYDEAEELLLQVHRDALTLEDDGVQARSAARNLAELYAQMGNGAAEEEWRARSEQRGSTSQRERDDATEPTRL